MDSPNPIVARIEKEHNYGSPWYKKLNPSQKYPNRIARYLFLKNFPRHFLTKYPNAFANIYDSAIDVGCPDDLQFKSTASSSDNAHTNLNGKASNNNNRTNNHYNIPIIDMVDEDITKSSEECDDDMLKNQVLDTSMWTQQMDRLYFEIIQILKQYHLTKLVYTTNDNSTNNEIRKLNLLDDASFHFRHSFGIIAGWDPEILIWLHNLITTKTHSHDHLIQSYHEVMDHLSKRLPFLIDRFYSTDSKLPSSIATTPATSAATTPVHPASGGVSTGGDTVLRPPRIRHPSGSHHHHANLSNTLSLDDDPAAKFVMQNNHTKSTPRRLASNPLILLVPSGPSIPSQPTSARMEYWKILLSSMGQLINITIAYRPEQNASEVLQVIKSNVRDKIRDLKKKKFNENRPLILVGFNQASLIAVHCALDNPGQVSSIICLGFPLSAMNGFRGDLDDPMSDMNIPILFVVGQMASRSTLDGLERLRESMSRSDTGLVIVGGANDKLIMNHKKKLYDGITQYHVDKSIADEIYEFVSTINLQNMEVFN